MREGCIYVISHASGAQYVGKTRNLTNRRFSHLEGSAAPQWALRLNPLADRPDILSKIRENCSLTIVEQWESVSDEDLSEAETDWILLLMPKLNGERPIRYSAYKMKMWELREFIVERGLRDYWHTTVMTKESLYEVYAQWRATQASIRRGKVLARFLGKPIDSLETLVGRMMKECQLSQKP
jgi:hypothetical protein